ncbi:TetR/AcrR family transcriptional regulator [Cytobacillus spongiae]|uniref:TetR/AcrR family transcriptional regulator n=1 Tax=Cytobacillus spongiae TaxID=2901381 RepID=UPI001F2C2422|nr:TetR/AcrR family transcriptional regulator [Cytobacillus spongiae]UII55829.1 TetR/AcrR family transcriptional regulator [Cytobacillus spongiae]
MSYEEKYFEELFEQSNDFTEKQKKIMIAAIESFSEKGYAATSTSEIAKKAGVAEGTIFRHYKTKKDLLLSIVAPVMAKLIAPFVIKDLYKVLNHDYDQFEDFLRAMIKNRTEFLRNNMPLFKILLQEIPFQPELKQQFQEHIANKVFDRFKKLIEHYQAKGEIIDLPSVAIIRTTASIVFGYLLSRYLLFPEGDWDDEKEIEQTISFIMNGISAKK